MSGDKISIFLIYDQNIELLSKGIISQLTEALARADPNQKERKNEKTKNKPKKKTLHQFIPSDRALVSSIIAELMGLFFGPGVRG